MLSASGKWLEKYPFLRFDIPYILGIIICNAGLLCAEWTHPIVMMIGCVFSFLLLVVTERFNSYTHRYLWGMSLMIFLFCLGFLRMDLCRRNVVTEWSKEQTVYRGWVSGIPEEKMKSWMIPLEVNNRQILLYLPKDSCAANLKCGDEIYFYTRIYKPLNRGDVKEFDYASYLLHQGISGTAYASADNWKKAKGKRALTWKQSALNIRESLIENYRSWGFSDDELAVVSALTLGDKRMLDDSLKMSYSVAGASHILALSGLHLGIVAGILSTLLFFRPSFGKRLWLRGILIILSLWVFAYITGLSGSVVRSAVMFTIFIIGRCMNRRGVLLNSLAMAAFVMLLYNPFYLYDVGFQMSFMAVIGIALFMPVFQKLKLFSENSLFNYVQNLMWVSVAAQLGVAPLVIYYFENFPVYFLLTNLIVVPMSFLILTCSVILWSVCWFEWLHQWLVDGLQMLLWGLNNAVLYISHLPMASISISFSWMELFVCYLLLLLSLVYYYRRSIRSILYAQFVLCILFLYYVIIDWYPRDPELAFYVNREQENVIRMTTSSGSINIIKTHEYGSDLILFSGKYIGILGDERCGQIDVDCPYNIEILYVNAKYTGNFSKLLSSIKVNRAVVVEASARKYVVDDIKLSCKKWNIPLILLSEEGSYTLAL